VWPDFKVYDMQALDRIATEDETYRPLTCYPGAGNHECHLPRDARSVLKRSHSYSAKQVRTVPANKRGMPVCQNLPMDGNDAVPHGFHRWVHQEHVSSFVTFGEFRVFVATQASDDSTRTPYVVHAIRTWWTDKMIRNFSETKVFKFEDWSYHYSAACVTHEDDWHEYQFPDYDKLVSFALHIYRSLQSLNATGFQSLDVGVRLDFALQIQSQPGDKICRAYARAFAETRDRIAPEHNVGSGVAQVAVAHYMPMKIRRV
jgi:hypothetical protein